CLAICHTVLPEGDETPRRQIRLHIKLHCLIRRTPTMNSRNTLYHHLSDAGLEQYNYPLSSFKILKDGLWKGADSTFNCYLWVNTRSTWVYDNIPLHQQSMGT
ncbi:hypothetical protein M8C21_019375, partial [Ambrosia artemisiifolia]